MRAGEFELTDVSYAAGPASVGSAAGKQLEYRAGEAVAGAASASLRGVSYSTVASLPARTTVRAEELAAHAGYYQSPSGAHQAVDYRGADIESSTSSLGTRIGVGSSTVTGLRSQTSGAGFVEVGSAGITSAKGRLGAYGGRDVELQASVSALSTSYGDLPRIDFKLDKRGDGELSLEFNARHATLLEETAGRAAAAILKAAGRLTLTIQVNRFEMSPRGVKLSGKGLGRLAALVVNAIARRIENREYDVQLLKRINEQLGYRRG